MKITLPQIRRFCLTLTLIFFSFSGGWLAHKNGLTLFEKREISQNHKDVDFSLFWKVWDKLESDYYDKSKIKEDDMVLGAIKGMVSSIGDPYTAFLPPTEQKRTQEDLSGSFEGVGIEIGFKGTRLAVITPLEGSPADKAGVKAGDFIVGIKEPGKNTFLSTSNMGLVDAVEKIRGEAGTSVTLMVSREDVPNPLEFSIERGKIDVPSVKLTYDTQGKNIATLRLYRFGGNTDGEWDKVIREVKSKKVEGLILDLRNNPGGYLPGAVKVVSEFVSSGPAVLTEDGSGKKKELGVSGKPTLPDIPLVVLVNGGSASASEIVAGALKDYNRAKIVGEKTFGKGTIQEARPVGNSGLHITIAKWLTPKGTWVHETGLVPDVTVVNNPDTEVDEQSEEAVKNI